MIISFYSAIANADSKSDNISKCKEHNIDYENPTKLVEKACESIKKDSEGPLIFATGPSKNTNTKIFEEDINKYCGSKDNKVKLLEYKTCGGKCNYDLIVDNQVVDIGFVPIDVAKIKTKNEVISSLVSLNRQAMHIIVSRKENNKCGGQIKSLRDLKGRKVVVYGSSELAIPKISEILNLNIKLYDKPIPDKDGHEQAKKLVLDGEVCAYIIMGAQPMDLVKELDKSKFTLAKIDLVDIQVIKEDKNIWGAYYLETLNTYNDIINNDGKTSANIETISSKNEIFVSTNNRKEMQLNQLKECIRENLRNFKSDGHSSLSDVTNIEPTWDNTWHPSKNWLQLFLDRFSQNN